VSLDFPIGGDCFLVSESLMLFTIQSRIFFLLVCCLKTQELESKILILPVVLCGCGTSCLTLRGKHGQCV
jgi:hypothetical protein